jgi:1-acyl-sn-glycerol-3-phosphate acyltransferase
MSNLSQVVPAPESPKLDESRAVARHHLPWIVGRAILKTLAISFPTVLEAIVRRVTRAKCDRRLDGWARQLVDDAGIRLDVVAPEGGIPEGPWIAMSNHESLYDIPVLFRVLPQSLRMVAKVELFRVPIWGRAMSSAGFVAIDRNNRSKAFRSLAEAKRRLESGINVWIAPEGTRSRTGELLPFKKGGFMLAKDIGVPILPISIRGTRDVLPAKTWKFRVETPVRVTVHPLVDPAGFADRDALMQHVRGIISSGL